MTARNRPPTGAAQNRNFETGRSRRHRRAVVALQVWMPRSRLNPAPRQCSVPRRHHAEDLERSGTGRPMASGVGRRQGGCLASSWQRLREVAIASEWRSAADSCVCTRQRVRSTRRRGPLSARPAHVCIYQTGLFCNSQNDVPANSDAAAVGSNAVLPVRF